MGFAPGPGEGGSSSIAGSSDVALNSLENDQLLSYSTESSKWQNVVGLDGKIDKTTVVGFGAGTQLPSSAPDGTVFFLYSDDN